MLYKSLKKKHFSLLWDISFLKKKYCLKWRNDFPLYPLNPIFSFQEKKTVAQKKYDTVEPKTQIMRTFLSQRKHISEPEPEHEHEPEPGSGSNTSSSRPQDILGQEKEVLGQGKEL